MITSFKHAPKGPKEHFSNKKLLELSFVNKLWNQEARNVLRDRGNVIAKMCSFRSCQNLRAFATDLSQMNVSPFSGITISLDGCNHFDTCEQSTEELDPLYHVIVDRVKWKYLAVELDGSWKRCKNCPASLLAKKILQDYGGQLKHGSLQLRCDHNEFIYDVLQACSFPRMKFLKLGYIDFNYLAPPNLIKALVSRAPVLQEFHTETRLSLTENFLQGTSAVLVTDYNIDPFITEINESIIPVLRMKGLSLSTLNENFNMERLNSFMPSLLQASRTTITSMSIDAVFLIPFMCYGISMENVGRLTLFLDVDQLHYFQPQILRLVKNFDFARIFPRLSYINCSCSSRVNFLQEAMNEMVEQWTAASYDPQPDRAANVKILRLPYSSGLEDSTLGFLTEMLPHIETLSWSVFLDEDIPFSFIWDHYWPNLTEIRVEKLGNSSPGSTANLDSAFCGIFPEEVAQLQDQDEEYLRRVNIVPVMPSVTCVKGLKSVSIFYRTWFGGQVHDPVFVVSKVTGLVALQIFPGLSVSFITDDERYKRALSSIQPYASVGFAYQMYEGDENHD